MSAVADRHFLADRDSHANRDYHADRDYYADCDSQQLAKPAAVHERSDREHLQHGHCDRERLEVADRHR